MKRNQKEVVLNEDFAGKRAGESLVTSFGIAASLIARGVAKLPGEQVAVSPEVTNPEPPVTPEPKLEDIIPQPIPEITDAEPIEPQENATPETKVATKPDPKPTTKKTK